jgi:hypothetical protein
MNSLESFVKFIPSATTASVNASNAAILTDVESKARKFTNSLNDIMYETSNEPSLGFYRIQVGPSVQLYFSLIHIVFIGPFCLFKRNTFVRQYRI